jgi:hypothetical protein
MKIAFEILVRPDGTEDLLPPAVNQAWSEISTDGLTFYVDAIDAASPVERVLVTYNTPDHPDWQWQSELLSFDADGGLWTSTVSDLNITTAFFVQAVDAAGNMSVSSEGGQYYVDGLDNQIINVINDPHTFTITTYADSGSGVAAMNGLNPDVDLTRSDGSPLTPEEDTCETLGTGHEGVDDGECQVTFVSGAPDTVDVTASVEFFGNLGLSATAITSAEKVFYASQLAPTQTTCQDFIGSTAEDLDTIFYGAKDGLINNASPGVFYYFNGVVAPSRDFNVSIGQDSIPGFALFEVQNDQQLRLYNGDCSTPSNVSLSLSYQGDDLVLSVSGAKKNETYVISVKYDTGSIVGEIAPVSEIGYLFETNVDGSVSGKDHLVLTER